MWTAFFFFFRFTKLLKFVNLWLLINLRSFHLLFLQICFSASNSFSFTFWDSSDINAKHVDIVSYVLISLWGSVHLKKKVSSSDFIIFIGLCFLISILLVSLFSVFFQFQILYFSVLKFPFDTFSLFLLLCVESSTFKSVNFISLKIVIMAGYNISFWLTIPRLRLSCVWHLLLVFALEYFRFLWFLVCHRILDCIQGIFLFCKLLGHVKTLWRMLI